MSVFAENVAELEVYRAAFDLQQRVFELSKNWPAEERYSLTDQARRASRSVGANISEAWAKRRHEAHFVSKMTDAEGELAEIRHWITTANACAYLAEVDFVDLRQRADAIGRMLGKMLGEAHRWVITSKPSNTRR